MHQEQVGCDGREVSFPQFPFESSLSAAKGLAEEVGALLADQHRERCCAREHLDYFWLTSGGVSESVVVLVTRNSGSTTSRRAWRRSTFSALRFSVGSR